MKRPRSGAVELKLKPAGARCEALHWYGTRGVAVACRPGPGALTLSCEVGRVEALGPPPRGWPPSHVKKGELPRRVLALRCRAGAGAGAALPEALSRLAFMGRIPFTHAPGLMVYERKEVSLTGNRRILRQQDP